MDLRTAVAPAAPRRAASRTWTALAAYTAGFAVAAWPWLRVMGDSVPRSSYGNRSDERLVAYVLAWGAHALGRQPFDLFAMPINYPAPAQLAGSEHFLSSQLLFAPCFWLTGNAVLAANLAVFAAYPLGAAAMYWLVHRLGCDRLVAFAAGLALVLGAGQVPAHLHLLQYLVVYLPLVAGMLTQLRLEPDARRTAGLALVCLLAFFSSYYACVLTLLVAALWGLAELCRRQPGRLGFAVRVAVGMGIPAILLALFSLPYLERPEALSAAVSARRATSSSGATLLLAGTYSASAGTLLRLLAVSGLAALWSRVPAARLVARRGLLCAIVGGLFMLGPGLQMGDVFVRFPYAAVAASPLAFFRYPHRFIAVVTFGRALLIAGALEGLRQLLPRRLGTCVPLAVSVGLLVTRAPLIGAGPYDVIEVVRDPIYDLVGPAVAAGGGGSLLELPIIPPAAGGRFWTEGDALVGQTRHWIPLVGGHTGYQPPHRALVNEAIQRLPAASAIQFLVDTTHVRWLLLRPLAQWPEKAHRQREALERAPWASPVTSLGGWVLLRVEPDPSRHDFFADVARGWRPGETALGTPVVPVPDAEARATITGHLPKLVRQGSAPLMHLLVRNEGATTWPVSVPTFAGSLEAAYAGEVWLRATWRRIAPGPAGDPVAFDVALPRDVRGHETLGHAFAVPTPPEPGTYELELAVQQRNGIGFTAPTSQSLRGKVEVR